MQANRSCTSSFVATRSRRGTAGSNSAILDTTHGICSRRCVRIARVDGPAHRATGLSAASQPSPGSLCHASAPSQPPPPCSERLLRSRCLSGVLSGALYAAAGLYALPPAAHAHIPTDTVLNSSRSTEGGFSRSELTALQQLAAPPAAVVTPAGRPTGRTVEAEWPFESRPAAGDAGTSSSGASGSGRAALPPGTVVGTPNYLAREGGAGRLPGGAAAAAAAAAGGGGARPGASAAQAALTLLAAAREAVDAGEHQRAYELYGRLVREHGDLALSYYGRVGRALQAYQLGAVSDSLLALEDEEAALRGAAEVHAALAALLYTERPSLALRAEEEWAIASSFDKRYSDPAWVAANKHWPPRAVAALQRFLALS